MKKILLSVVTALSVFTLAACGTLEAPTTSLFSSFPPQA
ncbi:methionine ABC transporter substrate-binding protein, partial [Bacillus sp. D-CC]